MDYAHKNAEAGDWLKLTAFPEEVTVLDAGMNASEGCDWTR